MQIRNIILGVVGVLVLLGFFTLVVESQGARSAQVDDAEMDQALTAYRRSESRRSSSTTTPTPSIPRPRTRSKPSAASTAGSSDSHPEPYTTPAPEETEIFREKADLKTQMNDANRFYDKADYEGAREAALAVLSTNENNVRMQRIVVSSSCIMGEEKLAKEHYQNLPSRDQRQMARRCKRYGIEFEEAQ